MVNGILEGGVWTVANNNGPLCVERLKQPTGRLSGLCGEDVPHVRPRLQSAPAYNRAFARFSMKSTRC